MKRKKWLNFGTGPDPESQIQDRVFTIARSGIFDIFRHSRMFELYECFRDLFCSVGHCRLVDVFSEPSELIY